MMISIRTVYGKYAGDRQEYTYEGYMSYEGMRVNHVECELDLRGRQAF